MEEVWARGRATVREVLDALNARSGKERAYTTVMTVMSRLDTQKRMLSRVRRGRSNVYRASIERETYLEARAAAQVTALVDEYGDVALVHFARQMSQLDPKRARELRASAKHD